MVKQVMALFTVALLALFFGGCCDSSPPRNVTVELDDYMHSQLSNRSVEVHLVALNSSDAPRWEKYSMNKYWQPGDALMNSVPIYKMIFTTAEPGPKTLSDKDPFWTKWHDQSPSEKNMQLFALLLMPGQTTDAEGSNDPRRQIIPLNCKQWKDPSSTIRLQVRQTGITTLTPPDKK